VNAMILTEPKTTPTGATLSEELLRRFQNGDRDALDRLWARYLPRLRRWAHGRLPRASRDTTSTDDLVQDAFVRSLAHLRALKPMPGCNLFSYFRTIVLNLCRDHARRGTTRPGKTLLESDRYVTGEPSPLEHAIGQEALAHYEAALDTLSPLDQQLIRAHLELACSDEELAELFEKPTARAARVARGRALTRLAQAMKTSRACLTASA